MSEHFRRRESDVVSVMSWIIRVGGTLAAVGIIGGAVAWAADTRYEQRGVAQQAADQSADKLRRAIIEDKIFELNFISPGKLTDLQRAQLERFKREAEVLDRKVNKQ
jgi:hypothetical protein